MIIRKTISLVTLAISIIFSIAEIQAQSCKPAAVQIAESNHPLATAYNNGRRLVRDTSWQRYVVYQDINEGIPIVCLSRSQDGETWSLPDTLADGAFPAIAIDNKDRLFVVWQAADTAAIYFTYSTNLGSSWQIPPINISQSSSGRTRFPVIETGRSRLHIAWQQEIYLPDRGWRQQIFYTALALDSLESNFVIPINISLSHIDSKFPSIAHNLMFEPGNLHVVWYDSIATDSLNLTLIRHRAVDETLFTWNPQLSQPSNLLSDDCGCYAVHPAVSVGAGEIVHVVWGHRQNQGFHSFLFNTGGFPLFGPFEIRTAVDRFICVDDIYFKSSALVWMEYNEIYYMQSRDAQLISSDYTPVSQIDATQSRYPGVCYKHFRWDSLDVVWTDGNSAPYKIMYRRMAKIYSSHEIGNIRNGNQIPQQFVLKQNYPNPFNSSTVIQYSLTEDAFVRLAIFDLVGQKVRALAAGLKPAGCYQACWDGKDESGVMLPSGLYFYRLSVDDSRWIAAKKLVVVK